MQFDPVDDAGQGAPVDTAQPSPDLWTYADLGGFVLFSLGAQLACRIGAYGIAFAVIAVAGGTQRVDCEPVETLLFVTSSVTSAIASLGYVYYVVAIKYRLPFWEALGFTPIRRRMYWFLLLGAVISVTEGMLGGLIGVPTDTPFAELLSNRATYLLMVAAAILIAPPLEEVLFRGFLYRPLERSWGPLGAIVVTSVIFSLLHGRQYAWSWRIILLLTMTGVCLGIARWKTSSLWPPILLHGGANAVPVVAFGMHNWG